ncbi:MAG TPA: hypothetical protein VE861_07560, partial [Gemmatimonadaceae bacterium]|nr:hypothetical protein [Gemmatimonadaceae bacterium]
MPRPPASASFITRATVSIALLGALAAPLPTAARGQATTAPSRRPSTSAAVATAQWTPDRAKAWYDSLGWVAGANYVPSTASNQLEMWQAATWDPATIDRELGWAQQLGMNTMRVYLHDLLWRQDSTGFLRRMDEFLTIASRRGIRPIFVLFDAVWDPFPKLGKQREPYPFLHNSAWVQSPGVVILTDTARHDALRPYVQGVVRRFARDRRVLAWDVFNEPDNINRSAYFVYEPRNKEAYALPLMRKAFGWARAVGVTQPLTAAPWKGDYADTTKMLPISKWMFENSDIISIHSYDSLPRTQALVAAVRRYDRPVIISEYMARPNGSTFQTQLPWLAEQRVGAINWGFVNGRSQTIYPWDTWTREYTAPPTVWFHDILQADGTPYDTVETSLIRRVTSATLQRGRGGGTGGGSGAGSNPAAGAGTGAASASASPAPPAAAAAPPAQAATSARVAADTSTTVTRQPFGTLPDGKAVELFTLRNAHGLEVRVTNYGGIITHVMTPDRNQRLDDIVLGYDSLAGYLKESPYFGAIVGRVANRVARGKFSLEGQPYTLAVNNGLNALHGGLRGFDKVVWAATPFTNETGQGVTLRYVSADGEEGYPGTLTTMVRYTLTPSDELMVEYEATTDRATPVNLSQHTYWNLAGTGAASGQGTPLPGIGEHRLTINAGAFTPVDSTLIPTGTIAPVTGTPLDFRQSTPIGARIGDPHQ